MKTYILTYQNSGEIKNLTIKTDDLSKENLPSNIINIKESNLSSFDFRFIHKYSLNKKEINLLFYELNLMLNANISINDALEITHKNRKNKNLQLFITQIKGSFSNVLSIEDVLKNFKVDFLIISFLKLSKESGNISANIQALNSLLIENEEIKKSVKKSISYPIILLVSFLFSLHSIFFFVIPKFKTIFDSFQGELPFATKLLLKTQYIFENYSLLLVSIFSLITLFLIFLYKTNPNISFIFDKILIKNIFLIRDVYLNMQLYKIFLILEIMLKSNYEFHKALILSEILLKNKYLLDRIRLIDKLLQNGKNIKNSFEESGIFDDIVLNLLNTGEISNSLVITVGEIKKIYKNRFDEKVALLTSLIQPIFLVVIMSLILWIVLAIFVPIWDMGNMIKV